MTVPIHAVQEDQTSEGAAASPGAAERGYLMNASDATPVGTPSDAGSRPDEFVAVARSAGSRLHDISAEIAECSARRQTAVRALRDRFGWSHQQVADALAISRSQAQSIYEGRSSSGRPTSTRGQEPED